MEEQEQKHIPVSVCAPHQANALLTNNPSAHIISNNGHLDAVTKALTQRTAMAVLTTAAATKQGIQDFITAAAARRTTCKEQLPPLTTPSKTPPLIANLSEEFKTNGLGNTNQVDLKAAEESNDGS